MTVLAVNSQTDKLGWNACFGMTDLTIRVKAKSISKITLNITHIPGISNSKKIITIIT